VVLVVLGFHAAIAAISAVAIPYSGLNQFVQVADITGRERVRGLALEPGFYAVACVALMPACAALAVDRTAPRWRFVPVLAVFAALLAGGARGGLVLAVPAALIGIALGRPEILRMRPRRAFALSAAIAACCVLVVVAIPSLHAEVSRLTAGNSDVSNSQRVRLYETVARVVRDHPIIGVGDVGDPELLKRYGYGEFFVVGEGTALNVVLQTVGETGAPGGAVLLAMLAGLGLALRMKTDDSADVRLARALVAGGLLTLVLYGLALSLNWDLRVWVPIALGIAGLLLHPGPADQTVELGDAAVSA
jgi:O-antigen ligase